MLGAHVTRYLTGVQVFPNCDRRDQAVMTDKEKDGVAPAPASGVVTIDAAQLAKLAAEGCAYAASSKSVSRG